MVHSASSIPARHRYLCPPRTTEHYLRFALEVGREFDSTVLFVRARHVVDGDGDDPLAADIGIVELPYYESLVDLGQVARAVPGTIRAFWRGLDQRVDAVWAVGPHPFSFVLIALASSVESVSCWAYARTRSNIPLAAPERTKGRAPCCGSCAHRSGCRHEPRPGDRGLGPDLKRQYGGPRARVLAINISQIRTSDVVAAPPRRDWTGTVRLLTVDGTEQEHRSFMMKTSRSTIDGDPSDSLPGYGEVFESEVKPVSSELAVLFGGSS